MPYLFASATSAAFCTSVASSLTFHLKLPVNHIVLENISINTDQAIRQSHYSLLMFYKPLQLQHLNYLL